LPGIVDKLFTKPTTSVSYSRAERNWSLFELQSKRLPTPTASVS
jgi:hypothetical protein